MPQHVISSTELKSKIIFNAIMLNSNLNNLKLKTYINAFECWLENEMKIVFDCGVRESCKTTLRFLN